MRATYLTHTRRQSGAATVHGFAADAAALQSLRESEEDGVEQEGAPAALAGEGLARLQVAADEAEGEGEGEEVEEYTEEEGEGEEVEVPLEHRLSSPKPDLFDDPRLNAGPNAMRKSICEAGPTLTRARALTQEL